MIIRCALTCSLKLVKPDRCPQEKSGGLRTEVTNISYTVVVAASKLICKKQGVWAAFVTPLLI